jgi:hypothetical protein
VLPEAYVRVLRFRGTERGTGANQAIVELGAHDVRHGAEQKNAGYAVSAIINKALQEYREQIARMLPQRKELITVNTQLPQTPQAWQPPQAPRQSSRKPVLIILAMLFVPVALLLIIGTIISGTGSGGSQPAWKAVITRPAPFPGPPGTLNVFFAYTNTSGSTATPRCIISASGSGHSGTDTLDELAPVAAGQTGTDVAEVHVSGNGARFITSVTVTCR